jgi:hypothetical protein
VKLKIFADKNISLGQVPKGPLALRRDNKFLSMTVVVFNKNKIDITIIKSSLY